jgi:hypothetical protein
MNALDILKYGHRDVLESIKSLTDDLKEKPGVTTTWSVKDTLAHLASYEHLLEDVLNSVLKPGSPTPCLDAMISSKNFNDEQVSTYKDSDFEEVLSDYDSTNERIVGIMGLLEPAKLQEVGTIPWYGNEYSLDDFIVYASYGHKREHAGNIKQFLKRQHA